MHSDFDKCNLFNHISIINKIFIKFNELNAKEFKKCEVRNVDCEVKINLKIPLALAN